MEAAAALTDEQRRSVGQKTTDEHPLRLIFGEIKKDAREEVWRMQRSVRS